MKGVYFLQEFPVVVLLAILSLFLSLNYSAEGFLLVRHHPNSRHSQPVLVSNPNRPSAANQRSQPELFSLQANNNVFRNLSMAITTRKQQQQQQKLRFGIGDSILCYCSEGWTLGRVVALNYREDHWPSSQQTAPYQVLLDGYDRRLIYVPIDDDRICKKPTPEDFNVANRLDALATTEKNGVDATAAGNNNRNPNLTNTPNQNSKHGFPSNYRDGTCESCDSCPQSWTAVELYSEHYRAAVRNHLPIVRHSIDLGTVRVGDDLEYQPENISVDEGFSQCPTLPRLPPGIAFSDDGSLRGKIRFDPYRSTNYKVEFVAVSTIQWQTIGLVRLQLNFEVVHNNSPPPSGFDQQQFDLAQQAARDRGNASLKKIYSAWNAWEQNQLSHQHTIQQLSLALRELRLLCQEHPRLDDGIWWTQLGGYHMNVHKLLENKLFECELYLGQALLMPSANVRRRAEQNLNGCYQKRLLETARFVWYDGLDQLIAGDYANAMETFRIAAKKKDGWGWGVNHGDMYIAEAAALFLEGAHQIRSIRHLEEGHRNLERIPALLDKARERWNDRDGEPNEHPWAMDIRKALQEHADLLRSNASTKALLASSRERTVLWCTHAIQGLAPFPPKTKPRPNNQVEELIRSMPGHHPHSYE